MCVAGVCTSSRCGNSVIEDTEACDDGNTRAGDGCSSDCRSIETCGNGTIDSSRGELCDDGNTADGDGCQADCTLPLCGDGVKDAGELCDDGNRADGDGCNALCSSLETCQNGVIDAGAGEQCDDGNATAGDTCQPNCRVPRCGDGLTDTSRGELCDEGDNNSDAPDASCRLNCLPRRCGDTIEDSDEVCDDGNAAANDGCTPDCDSNETCGNHYPDVLAGELCDDGKERSHDGCDNTCALETATWIQEVAGPPPARTESAVAYDAARDVMVMFGGGISPMYGDTWEWDGVRWSKRVTLRSPTPRRGAAMTYDAGRGRIVLFGGVSGGLLDDTWEYDGATWTPRAPATVPPARYVHAMAYDAKRKRVVMFGGTSATATAQTWEWDGINWSLRPTVGGPAMRSDPVMAFHPVSGTIMLFGGRLPNGQFQFDTWEWDGTTWTDKAPATTPSGGENAITLTFDVARTVMVLAIRDRTYEWNGSDWVLKATSTSATLADRVAYSAARGKLVRFDPYDLGDFFEWNGTTWGNRIMHAEQPKAFPARMAFDTQSQTLVLFGYSQGTGVGNDTWLRGGGGSWYRASPTTVPPARSDHAIVYDAARDRVVVFGGNVGSTRFGDTWLYDANTQSWTNANPTNAPTARANAAMAFDSVRGEVVLFGGQTASGITNDTWVWNGSDWAQKTVASSIPTERTGTAMAFDPVRQRVVLFGGSGSGGHRADTWEWDGSAWAVRSPVNVPSARADHTLTFDTVRGKIVMYGRDLWEWDGTNWTLRPEVGPGARSGAAIVYDAPRSTSVLFGGLIDDTWAWNGTQWLLEIPASGPPSAHSVIGYDAGRGTTLMHSSGGTWQWDGNSHWTQKVLTTAQPVKLDTLVYDSGRRRLVGTGRPTDQVVPFDTWEWDGTSWTKKASFSVYRDGVALAYDAERGKVVLFGGQQGGTYPAETWEWDGTSWSMKTPTTTVPLGRSHHAMAYDAVRKKVVMFGGFNATAQPNLLRDTWEWDGADWKLITAANTPFARRQHAMVWNAATKSVLVFGGISAFDSQYDVWAWDGIDWKEISATAPTSFGPIAYDAAHAQLVMQGNPALASTNAASTWRMRYDSGVADQSCRQQPHSDFDADALVGTCSATLFDPDCKAWCDPLCEIAGSCTDTLRPRCGDTTCNPVLESYQSCPADCTPPAASCGNFFCDAGETAVSCPGDC